MRNQLDSLVAMGTLTWGELGDSLGYVNRHDAFGRGEAKLEKERSQPAPYKMNCNLCCH